MRRGTVPVCRARKAAVFGGIDQAGKFLLQALQNLTHAVDGLLHLFVIALIILGDQLIDPAAGNLGQDAVAFADRQQDRVQHSVDTPSAGFAPQHLVHPAIIDSYLDGTLPRFVKPQPGDQSPDGQRLYPEEACVLRLIESYAAPSRKAA